MAGNSETEGFSNEVASIEEAEQRFKEKEPVIMKNVQDIKNKMKVENGKGPSNEK